MSALAEGLTVTIVGMGITLIALLLLSYILDLFGILSKAKSKEKPEMISEIAEETNIEEEEIEDDLELIAVITAAVAASLNTTTDQLQIRSFRRIGSKGSNWSSNAKQENLQIIE